MQGPDTTTVPKKKRTGNYKGRPKGATSSKMDALTVKQLVGPYKQFGLDLQQARFIAEYVSCGFCASTAYRAAINPDASSRTAAYNGHKLVADPAIRNVIIAVNNRWLANKRDKLEREIINQLYSQAFYDPAKLYRPDGTPAFDSWDEIPLELRWAVEGIETKFYGKDADRSIVTMKLADRTKALAMLAKYITLFQDRVPDAGPPGTVNNTQINLNGPLSQDTANRLRSIFAGVMTEGSSSGKGRQPDLLQPVNVAEGVNANLDGIT